MTCQAWNSDFELGDPVMSEVCTFISGSTNSISVKDLFFVFHNKGNVSLIYCIDHNSVETASGAILLRGT